MSSLPPSFLLIITALIVAVAPSRLTRSLSVLGLVATAVAIGYLPAGLALEVGFMKYTVALVVTDAVRTAIAWSILAGGLVAAVLSPQLGQQETARRTAVVGLLSVAFGLGVVLSGDLIAIFLQWELLTLTLAALIFFAGTEQARAAGIRFLLLQLVGGFFFKYGMHGYQSEFGSYLLTAASQSVLNIDGGWALIVGACIKLGAWPVAMVLPDAARSIGRAESVWLAIALPSSALVVLHGLLAPLPAALLSLGFVMVAYGLIYGVASRHALMRVARLGVGLTGLALVFGANEADALASLITWLIPSFYAFGFFLAAQGLSSPHEQSSQKPELLPDTDWIWRTGLFHIARALANIGFILRDVISETGLGLVSALQKVAHRFMGSGATLARTWGIGYTAIWVMGLLALYGVLYLTL